LFEGILPLDRAGIGPDILAGITLAALGIPAVIGYTKIIGMPVITGLYTILVPTLVFACFGSSRLLVVGADSATAAIVASALVPLAVPYSPRYAALAGLVALIAGGMLLLARAFRLGFLADFLSRTVLIGFLTGVGVQVALGQIHGMLGLEQNGHGFLGQMASTFGRLPETHWPSLAIALVALGWIGGCDRFAPRFPGALLVVIGAIAASAFFHWSEHGLKIIGDVPGGLPRFGLPDVSFSDIPQVLSVSASCFIVILAQSAATARAFAARYQDRFDENVDLIGLSLANVAAGCSGAFVVNGSPTKTALVDSAGGRSQISQLTTVFIVLLTLLFLARPLSYLPEALLAAIVFLIGVKLIDVRGMADVLRKSRGEFALAVVTAATVVLAGVGQGILLALVLSLLDHVRHGYRPQTAVILSDPGEHWRMESVAPGRMIEPGLVMYWFGADLYYANANHFTEQARLLVAQSPSPVRWLVVDAGAITRIDYSAGGALRELREDLAKHGVVLALTRVSASLREDLDRQQLTEAIGAGRIFGSRRDCLAAYESQGLLKNLPPKT
jgi:high affinity sulfate transporter 1